ncbi:diphthine--ammonia ligase [Salirhabdus sp. Marseille-P4669]|uniref:Dph6-related ATP pyrophosphatase n=1 Tax=Salirhabdus sp. Marseille-P4669 TaxID=2042310 RepID=UPI0013567CD7|nr:diphthine--ammonia ligase [Salirhabdus sp. Marseille-P4669]
MTNRITISFSGGKDCTLGLYRILQSNNWEVDSLLTTITEGYHRTSIHGVREVLLEQQAKSLGIPLRKVFIPKNCSIKEYEKIMKDANRKLMEDGVTHIMFGDIHLKDIKEYRENSLKDTSLQPVFPLWNENPYDLIEEFLQLGFQAVLSCVDSTQLDPSFVGKKLNQTFLTELPANVDPCGENGEFHTFVYNGPLFRESIPFTISAEKTITKDVYTKEDRFHFVDLLPN